MPPAPGLARQSSVRLVLRVAGFVALLVALVLGALGVQDLVATADSFDGPSRFWMFFVAIPLLAVSGWCLQTGFLGAATRYGAGETLPVLKDGVAYLTDGRGRADSTATAGPAPYCRSCGTRNDADARFCDSCGTTLG